MSSTTRPDVSMVGRERLEQMYYYERERAMKAEAQAQEYFETLMEIKRHWAKLFPKETEL